MDKVTRYRSIIRQLVQQLAKLSMNGDNGTNGVETVAVCDDRRGNYLLLNVGWANGRRVRGTSVHIRLKNGKIWIEEDMTDVGIADELVQAGVPKRDIVLAFHSPEMRKLTEFATA